MRDYPFSERSGQSVLIRRFIFTENFLKPPLFRSLPPVAIYLKNVSLTGTPVYRIRYYKSSLFHYLFDSLTLSALNSNRYCRRVFKETVNKTLKVNELGGQPDDPY
jgi:hypothetical protein